MKKAIISVISILLVLEICGCKDPLTNNSQQVSNLSSEEGLFSAQGGWKNSDYATVCILDKDGTGSLINEVQPVSGQEGSNNTSIMASNITWEETEEKVDVTFQNGSYIFDKKKEGSEEFLELNGVRYKRLEEGEISQYKEKLSTGISSGGDSRSEGSRNEEIIMEEPITVIDNENITIKITRFFREVNNEGKSYEFIHTGFGIEAENKMDGYEISINPEDCSLSDRRVIEFGVLGNNNVAPGKIAEISIIRMDQKDFDDLERLYELEGNMDITVIKDHHYYSELGGKIPFSIPETMSAETEAADAARANEDYEDVINALSGKSWYYNGGKDTVLNCVRFSDSEAEISQVYYDGNGKHAGESQTCLYTIDDDEIHIRLEKDETLDVPYKFEDQDITLETDEYFTLEQIDEELQGYWNVRVEQTLLGRRNVTDHTIYIDNGHLTAESASLANGSTTGEYYYFGPDEGTYTMNFGGFDTDMRHGNEWFYNIIDGRVVLLHYHYVCTRTDSFPGENGYSF